MKNLLVVAILLIILNWSSNISAQYICIEGDCVNGVGKKQVKDSTAFLQGKFKEGVLLEGKVVFPNGNVFIGKFKNYKLTEGFKLFPNGQKLEGRFIGEVLVDGRITYKDGSSRRIILKPLGWKR